MQNCSLSWFRKHREALLEELEEVLGAGHREASIETN